MRKNFCRRTLLALFLGLLLISCAEPVPPEKMSYVGEWQSKEMYLLILQDGSVRYKRLKSGGTVEVTGPLKEFSGDDFIVGFSFITTTFVVSRPPFRDNGTWKMVVDGVELTKTE
jgi:hypothetical protein